MKRLPDVPHPEAHVAPRSPSGRLRPRRILVIDDNIDCAETLRELLELDGHAAVVAYDGPQALARGRESGPEIVLCDIGLPGQDGYQVAKAIRSDPGMRDAFLIAVTGHARAEDRQRAMDAGFDAHLPKPAPIDQIRRIVALAETAHPAGDTRGRPATSSAAYCQRVQRRGCDAAAPSGGSSGR